MAPDRRWCLWVAFAGALGDVSRASGVTVLTVAELVAAVDGRAVGDTIHVAPGTYTLAAPLKPTARGIARRARRFAAGAALTRAATRYRGVGSGLTRTLR